MRADRDKRAAILSAEGQRQSSILTAEGNKQSAILNAEGDRESQILRAQADREAAILRAQGEGQAIQTVFQAIHDGSPDQSLLAYQYLQMMPKIAEGDANKVWIVPARSARRSRASARRSTRSRGIPKGRGPATRVDMGRPAAELPERAPTDAEPGQRGGPGRDRRGRQRARTAADATGASPEPARTRPRRLPPGAARRGAPGQ